MDPEEVTTTAPRKRPLSVRTSKKDSKGGAREEERDGGEGKRDNGEVTEEEEEPLSPAGRLFHQPRFNCHIVAVMGSGKRIDVDAVKAGLAATLVRHPRFSSIPVLDETGCKKARWVRTKVDVANHLVVPDLDCLTTSSIPDQVVEDYVASLSGTTMDHSRPLWEFHLLNFPTSEAAAVIVLRMHHSLGDGTSLVSLLLALTRKSSDPDSLPSLPEARRRQSTAPAKPRSALVTLLLWLWAVLIMAWNTFLGVFVFIATAAFLKDTPTPLKAAEGVEFRPKRFVHRTMSLDDLKDIKNAMNCTINDVLVGITSAGLSRYLNRKYGESNDGKNKKQQLPKNIRITSTLLVNVRPTSGIHALSEMMGGKNGGAKWGNQLGYILLTFPIVMFEDPLDYVRKGIAIAERKKNSFEAIFTYWSAFLIVKIFGIKAAAVLSHRVLFNTTFSFSNIVGPVEEVAFYGHPIAYLAPSVYGHPQALTVHYQSYMNTMKVVLAVDELAIPDPHQLLDDLAESLRLVTEAITTRTKS